MKRKTKPKCCECDAKPAKSILGHPVDDMFCSVRCAARWALDRAVSSERWCSTCEHWSHPDDWGDGEGADRCPLCER